MFLLHLGTKTALMRKQIGEKEGYKSVTGAELSSNFDSQGQMLMVIVAKVEISHKM